MSRFSIKVRENGFDAKGRPNLEIISDELPPILAKYVKAQSHFTFQTLKTYLSRLQQFNNYLYQNAADLERYTEEHVKGHYETEERRLKQNTLKVLIQVILDYSGFLLENHKLVKSTFEEIQKYLKERRFERIRSGRVAATEEEIDAIKPFLKPYQRLILWFLLTFPVRITEMCNIRLFHINFEKREITFYIKPRGKELILPFTEEHEVKLKTILELRRLLYPKHDFLFCDSRGNRLDKYTAETWFLTASKKANVHITPHILRHTAAWNLYVKTNNIILVMHTLGHENIQTTMEYLGIKEEEKKKLLRQGMENTNYVI